MDAGQTGSGAPEGLMNHRSLFVAAAVALLSAQGAACHRSEFGPHGDIAEGILAPLGDPLPSANAEQLETFLRGQEVARRRFDRADGLGPAFNAVSCGACHERPNLGGGAATYRNFFLHGTRLDDGAYVMANTAGTSSGVVRVYSYAAEAPARPVIQDGVNVAGQRNAIPFYGTGLLAEIEDAEILSRADPDDADGDGISGRPNYDRGFVGRFGMKCQTVSIEGFIRGPLFNHLGVTTNPLSDSQRAALPVNSSSGGQAVRGSLSWLRDFAQAAAPDGPLTDSDGVADPEMSTDDLFDLVSFAMLTGAPDIERPGDAALRGQTVFDDAGCASCHTPRLEGPRGPIPAYSDLLLHDMGDALADGIVQGEALGSEFRTQPLWGVAAVGPYLHDGRARTLEAAITAHEGEGLRSRDAFAALSQGDRDDLIEFLRSLGGRSHTSPGLLPPDAEVPEVGAYGGPARDLTPAEEAEFRAGRALFDRDFGADEGAGGPRYNGDSCRACHFDPIVGGSGPRDTNVMRHGTVDDEGAFTAPGMGTILHKETTVLDELIEPADDVNVFEHRQPPHSFGLGLVEGIPESTVLLLADPDDEDGDGISGRASYTGDGRLGRFGWKAQVPSLGEFVRDAAAAEIGLTLEAQAGLSFGRTADDDAIADPEMSAAEAEQMVAFLTLLGPPPRQPPVDADQEGRGEQLFTDLGCARCHTPALEGADGPVPLFSDLLLHDILPPGSWGIPDGTATMTEFRTAPLWGLARTAPYLHNGEADTLLDAILAHDGEAVATRKRVQALETSDVDALIAFLATL